MIYNKSRVLFPGGFGIPIQELFEKMGDRRLTEDSPVYQFRVSTPVNNRLHERRTYNAFAGKQLPYLPQIRTRGYCKRAISEESLGKESLTMPPAYNKIEDSSFTEDWEETNNTPNNVNALQKAADSIRHGTGGPAAVKSFLNALHGRRELNLDREKRRQNMKKQKEKSFDLEELMDLMGRRSIRRTFYRNLDNLTGIAMGVASDTFYEFAENNLYTTLTIYGHYDTFISKSSVKVLLKYLYPKYGKHILMDVDSNFSMCSISIEKIKKTVLGFPELVNKTIRPGIYCVKVSDIGRGTWMIVLKNKLYNEGDISENGIRSEAKNFKTTIIFVGERKIGWRKRIQNEIDSYCSSLVTTSASSDKIRVQSMGGGDNSQNDIIIRPMKNLQFPQKEGLLDKIQTFLDSEKIYKDCGIPYRKGFLFTGPRGTGKTSFAFSLADHFHMECVSVDLSYFDTNGGANAFNGDNTIYVIDEIDAQLPKSRVSETHEAITVEQQKIIDRLHKLLKAMDDMSGGSIIIGTTNYPERLDTAIVRSGRFDELVEFNDLNKECAILMCKNRGLDPDEILAGESFPINPAYLEQKLIDALLRKNNIATKDLKSAEEIISDEFGEDALKTIPTSEPEFITAADLYAQLEDEYHREDYNIGEAEFAKIALVVFSKGNSTFDIDEDYDVTDILAKNVRIAKKDAESIREIFSDMEYIHKALDKYHATYGPKDNKSAGAYVNPDIAEMVEDDDDDEGVPAKESDKHFEVIASEKDDAHMAEDTDDED